MSNLSDTPDLPTPRARSLSLSLLSIGFTAALYALIVAVLAGWIGLCRLAGWTTDLRFFALTPEPYNNIFARGVAWCGLWVVLGLCTPFAWAAVGRRVSNPWIAGVVRFILIFLLVLAALSAWVIFAQLVGGRTDLTLGWATDNWLDNVLIRAAIWAAGLCGITLLETAGAKSPSTERAEDQPLATFNRLAIGVVLLAIIIGGAAFAMSQLFGPWAWAIFVPAVFAVPVMCARVPRRGDPG